MHPNVDRRCSTHWESFGKLLEWGGRWEEVGQKLGWGVFALIPETVISRKWVQQILPLDVLHIWLDLIKEYNREAVLLGERLATWIGCALDGAAVPTKRLRIEAVQGRELKDYSNKLDLFCEVDG